jgi:L-serine dehydratase
MTTISVFDIFKIGVGPSSSHTLGPWNAARQFLLALSGKQYDKIEVTLYGSLSKTGKGHSTDIAVVLGLLDYDPKTIDTQKIHGIIQSVRDSKSLKILDRLISFDLATHIVFSHQTKKAHPNTIIFKAYKDSRVSLQETYFSVGGGFIEKQGEIINLTDHDLFPYDMHNGKDVIRCVQEAGLGIASLVFENEKALRPAEEVLEKINFIYDTMQQCAYRGCQTAGILPGGLNVKRRANKLCEDLLEGKPYNSFDEWKHHITSAPRPFNYINKWISCFALAINEENAAMGRVVTSPTNGAAGVVPAVLMYYDYFCKETSENDAYKFILTAGLIGSLFKQGATISAAVGGCQAEIGVSSAMAAAGLTEVLGGTPNQVLMAAEIAMEHHLGLTCDPIGGLVQIPCIERNTMGAMKAITASNLALVSNPDDAKVDFDTVVKTMKDTAEAMNHKYKETSEGGLAYNLPVIIPEC